MNYEICTFCLLVTENGKIFQNGISYKIYYLKYKYKKFNGCIQILNRFQLVGWFKKLC